MKWTHHAKALLSKDLSSDSLSNLHFTICGTKGSGKNKSDRAQNIMREVKSQGKILHRQVITVAVLRNHVKSRHKQLGIDISARDFAVKRLGARDLKSLVDSLWKWGDEGPMPVRCMAHVFIGCASC